MKKVFFFAFVLFFTVILTTCNNPFWNAEKENNSGNENDADVYIITIEADIGGDASADKETAEQGAIVEITAEPKTGYVFDEWVVVSGEVTLSNSKNSFATFTMPDGLVTIKAIFKAIPVPVKVSDNLITYNGSPQGAKVEYDGDANTETAGTLTIIYKNDNYESETPPTNAGIYEILVTTTGGSGYLSYIEPLWVGTLTINKAVPVVSWPTGITASIWTGHFVGKESIPTKLSDIDLSSFSNDISGVFIWDDPEDIIGGLGLHTHNMTFISSNENYKNAVACVEIRVLLGVEMVPIPPANVIPPYTFVMGTPEADGGFNFERPVRTVTLSGFFMGKYQVTQEQWIAVMGSNPSFFTITNGRLPDGEEIQEKRPVERVSWYDAIVFCNRLSIAEDLFPAYRINNSTDPDDWGAVPTSFNATWKAVQLVTGSNGYRLPTEAEWEYACRAGKTGLWHFEGTDADLVNYAWYYGINIANSNEKTHEVGLKLHNYWGLYDMYGNVYEWCWDMYGIYPSENEDNPLGPNSGSYYVIRGGAASPSTIDPRSAYRSNNSPENRSFSVGFRVVLP